MQVDNSILSLSATIIFLLYIYFYLSPAKMLELICFSHKYYIAFVVASVVLMLLMHSGVVLVIGLLFIVFMMLLIIKGFPAIRSAEKFYDRQSGITIDRVIDRYYWPCKQNGKAYRRGRLFGIFPWKEIIDHHRFILDGKAYYSLKAFCKANPQLTGAAERALLRSTDS